MNNRIGDWLETFTGGQFWPLDPRPEDVDITDIAHSLSMQCRFNGHTRVFYSVAEHSIIVSKELKALGYNKLVQLYGLLHDASEAYTCDLPRPIKGQIKTYKAIEYWVQRAVWEAFKLPVPAGSTETAIHQMDNLLLGYEGRKLMRNTEDWAAKFGDFTPKSITTLGLTHILAKQYFLSLFADLTGGRFGGRMR